MKVRRKGKKVKKGERGDGFTVLKCKKKEDECVCL